MAWGISKSHGGLSSSLKKQGIVTILAGECDSYGDVSSNTSVASLRRTFSADLSSKNWLSPHGFCPMKTISSSEELHATVTDSQNSDDEVVEEESRSGFDIWAQIKEGKKNKDIDEESGVWSSILSRKSVPVKMVSPPYVHPIVNRRSSSSLSEKSLEICTESLGSETGSDGFSWFPSPAKGDANEEKDHHKMAVEAQEETRVANRNRNTTSCEESARGGSFPPKIPSLSSQYGKSLHMKTRRNNGRLVLEAVFMPSQNNFRATRQNGRLVLTLSDPKHKTHNANDREEQEERNSEILWFNEEDEGEKEEEEEEEPPNGLGLLGVYKVAHKPNGPVNSHRLAHKPIEISNTNPKWPEPEFSPAGDTAGTSCFNKNEYYRRPTKPIIENKPSSPNTKAQFEAQYSIKKPAGWLNGCKEQRRFLLFLEPFWIATS